jgi:hypothetical protein
MAVWISAKKNAKNAGKKRSRASFQGLSKSLTAGLLIALLTIPVGKPESDWGTERRAAN